MIKNFKNSFVAKFTSVTTILALLSIIVGPNFALAAGITTASDTLSRMQASTASDHTFLFTTPTGFASTQTMLLVFSAGFTGVSSMVANDFDFAIGSTGVCSSAVFTEQAVVTGAPSATQFQITAASQTVTITAGSGVSSSVGKCIRIKAGTHATDATGSGSPTHQITNGAVGSSDTITIGGGTFADSGTISVDIIDDDTVDVTASVNQTITFDIDTAADFSNSESSGPGYSVALGTLSAGSVTESNTSSVKMIVLEGDTNAGGGMVVTVRNTNGANGLASTSTPADQIPSATATMAAGTANYGLCVATSGLVGFTRATAYATTCALSSGTNAVVGLTSTAADILNSAGAPLASTAHAEVVVNAAISAITPAHSDYADALTFVATGTF